MSDLREAAKALTDFLWKTPMHGIPFHLVESVRAALSAEPAQEMTDEQIDALIGKVGIRKEMWMTNPPKFCSYVGQEADGDRCLHKFARAVIAADRASRLPAVTECNDNSGAVT